MRQVNPSISLLIYHSLLSRQSLTSHQTKQYEQLIKGFLGEKKLESILNEHTYQNITPLFGGLFEVNRSEFQIDCILITVNTLYLLEVKNYSGDYFIKNNHVYHLQSKREIYNSLSQLDRSTFLFKEILNELNITIRVKSYVVFVNDNFMLYEARVNLPIVFPSQIQRFLTKINENSTPHLETSEKINNILKENVKSHSDNEQFPLYNRGNVKQGLFCYRCYFPIERFGKFSFSCTNCAKIYDAEELLLHAISELKLLFPDEKITIASVYDWSGQLFSKSYLREFLKKNFHLIPKGRYSHYEFKDKNDYLKILSKSFRLLNS